MNLPIVGSAARVRHRAKVLTRLRKGPWCESAGSGRNSGLLKHLAYVEDYWFTE